MTQQVNQQTTPNTPRTERLLTIHEVMEKTSMGRSFIFNEIAAGRIKPIKMGRVNRFVESEIDQWILDRIASR